METTQNETKAAYLAYVMSQLMTVNQNEAVASYDTGYGLHIVNVSLGDECHCMDVVSNSILKIRPPTCQGETWFEAWSEGCLIVRQFCK